MKIGLLDHMGYGNLGDAATQEALIAHIRLRMPETQIVGFSLNPIDTEKRHGIPSYSITYWHPGLDRPAESGTGTNGSPVPRLKSFLKRIPVLSPSLRWVQNLVREVRHLGRSYLRVRSLDCLVIAGGGQLCELWRGPWSHPYNVFKFSLLTKLARKRLLIVNVGAGPLESRLGKIFIKCSVRLADYVSFRDVESQALVQRLGIRRETHVFPDSAYGLDVSQYRGPDTLTVRKPIIGINPIGFCDPRIWPRQDLAIYSRYLDELAQFLVRLSSESYELKIFSAERSVDAFAIEDLKDRLRAGLPGTDIDEICAPLIESVEGLMTEMAGFDFVITSKFHGVVFSHLLAKPVVAISYHVKIDDLMRNVGDSQYCLNIASFDAGSLQRAFAELAENGSALRMKCRQVAATRADSLNRQFDDLFVPENFLPRSRKRGSATAQTIREKSAWQNSSSALEEGER
ncbi:MAG: polysaccharide pyruvyl transferase family protein [Terracidiphilus sp.]